MCKSPADVSTQALKTYYQQVGAAQYNLNEALDALVTLIDPRKQLTQNKRNFWNCNKHTLTLYMGLPEQLVPSEIKKSRTPAFSASSRERNQSRPTQGGQRTNFQVTKRRPSQGPRGPSLKRGNPSAQKSRRYLNY